LLCRDRSLESAQAFFREAVAGEGASWPTKINLDGNAATHRGLRMLGDEDSRWQSVEIRARRYLNNIVGAPGKVWRFQRVKIPHRQGASHPTGNRALGLWR